MQADDFMQLYATDPAAARERALSEFMPVFKAFCLRSFARREDAEDAAQSASVEIVKSLGGWRGEASLRSWCWRVGMNVIAEQRARLYRREREQAAAFDEETCVIHASALASFRDNPFHAASAGELRALVEQALQRLPEGLRDALFLREYEGLSYAEIAHALGIPPGTVKSRLAAATVKLAGMLQSLREEQS